MAMLFKYGFFLRIFLTLIRPLLRTYVPDWSGILSKSIPSNAIETANTAVQNNTDYQPPFLINTLQGIDIVHGTWPTMLPPRRIATACKS